ncbi:MAG TPA: VanZ family protein [Noviherbaspirillum sp.]
MQSFVTLLTRDGQYRKLELRAAFLLYLAVLVCGSIPGARAELGELAPGLWLHLLTYSLIALLLFCGVDGRVWSKACKAVLIVAAMGALDEYVQSFFSYRTASFMDWFIDINAALLTSAVLSLLWPNADGGKSEEAS